MGLRLLRTLGELLEEGGRWWRDGGRVWKQSRERIRECIRRGWRGGSW